jgi:hypothetical protein
MEAEPAARSVPAGITAVSVVELTYVVTSADCCPETRIAKTSLLVNPKPVAVIVIAGPAATAAAGLMVRRTGETVIG